MRCDRPLWPHRGHDERHQAREAPPRTRWARPNQTITRKRASACNPPRGCRPQPSQTQNKPRTQQQITLIPAQPYVRRKQEHRCAIPERYAYGRASVENPDEPHSRSARNEETGLSSRVRTSRLCPCVVMRGLRCVPRRKIRGSQLLRVHQVNPRRCHTHHDSHRPVRVMNQRETAVK